MGRTLVRVCSAPNCTINNSEVASGILFSVNEIFTRSQKSCGKQLWACTNEHRKATLAAVMKDLPYRRSGDVSDSETSESLEEESEEEVAELVAPQEPVRQPLPRQPSQNVRPGRGLPPRRSVVSTQTPALPYHPDRLDAAGVRELNAAVAARSFGGRRTVNL